LVEIFESSVAIIMCRFHDIAFVNA